MASCSSALKPEKLPPSDRAAWFHVLRVYLQVPEWNRQMECTSNLQEWGWKLDDERFMPIMTDKAPAPDELLNIICCNCQVTSKNPCGGHTQCSCHKMVLSVWLLVVTVVGWSVRTVTLWN